MRVTEPTPQRVHQAAANAIALRKDRAVAAAATLLIAAAAVAPALLTVVAAVAPPCGRAVAAAVVACAVAAVAGMRGGGGGGRGGGGRGGGGRRSDIMLKHDIALIGHLDNGLGFYRFSYNGSDRAYVGVMAQEVQQIMPEAVVRGRDGYLRVDYDKLGLKFESYQQWLGSGGQVPHAVRMQR